jgi:hypothetical protein
MKSRGKRGSQQKVDCSEVSDRLPLTAWEETVNRRQHWETDMFVRCIRCIALITLTCAILNPQIAFPQARSVQTTPASVDTKIKVVQYAPNMSLEGLAPTDQVRMPGGQRVGVATLHRLDAAATKLRAPRTQIPLPPALFARPAVGGAPIYSMSDITAALAGKSDNETIQLPSGRRATVGQVRLLQRALERKLGRSFSSFGQRPNLAGPAVKLAAVGPKPTEQQKAEFRKLMTMPDNTVLESPHGKRMTVGELKQYLPKFAKAPRARSNAIPAKGTLDLQERRPQ